MNYYECHVTMLGAPDMIRPLVEAVGWKFSAIDGDPVLGGGVKCYATMLYNIRLGDMEVLKRLQSAAETLSAQCVVLRRKVERVIYDDRSDKVQDCTGNCGACGL